MKKLFCGNESDKMPGWAFRIMAFMFNIKDVFIPAGTKLKSFNISEGMTVVDWGCGTGRYLKRASELTGNTGTVYAVDIHELAIKSAFRQIRNYGLKNVRPMMTDGNSTDIPSHSVDLIFALDMFHMVRNTFIFLKELNRIIKENGVLIIEDGHQPRALSKKKLIRSGMWEIVEETKTHIRCRPEKRP